LNLSCNKINLFSSIFLDKIEVKNPFFELDLSVILNGRDKLIKAFQSLNNNKLLNKFLLDYSCYLNEPLEYIK
jgi:hypothetical protein